MIPQYKLKSNKAEEVSTDDVYYELASEEKPLYIKFFNLLAFPFIQPLRLVKFLFGRLFSYLIFNPLFRANEEENTLIGRNTKYSDDFTDEIVVVDVLPQQNIVIKHINNWIYNLKNYLFYSGRFPWDRGSDKPLAPEKTHNHARIAELIGIYVCLINGRLLPGQFKDQIKNRNYEQQQFAPNQIHFRGLHSLSIEARNAFFDNLSLLGYNLQAAQEKYAFSKLKTRQGNELCCVEIRGQNVNLNDIKDRDFIIFCCPRSSNYLPWLKQLRYLADKTSSTVVTCNYNGTGNSKGLIAGQTDLKNNALALFERLIALGADPKKIAFFGESLGANIASQAAIDLNHCGFEVGLFNSRSFVSTKDILLGKIYETKHAKKLYNPLNWGRLITAFIVNIIVDPILYLTDWDLNIKKGILKVPFQNLDLIVVRSRKDENGNRFVDDKLGHESSIYKLIRIYQKNIIKIKQEESATLTLQETRIHDTNLNKCKFVVGQKFFPNAARVNGHIVPAKCLIQREGETENISGRDYQVAFFNRFFKVQNREEGCNNNLFYPII